MSDLDKIRAALAGGDAIAAARDIAVALIACLTILGVCVVLGGGG